MIQAGTAVLEERGYQHDPQILCDLPEPVGMTLWYALPGSIGGIASGTWKWGYGSGLFAIVILWPLLIIWP